MTVALTNSTLIEIRGAGVPDRSGDVDDTGSVLWSGRAAGYLKRQRRTVMSGGDQVRDDKDVFTILNSTAVPVVGLAGPDWDATTIVVEDERTGVVVRRRFTVDAMENRAAGTIVDSVRMELSGETVIA